MSVLKPYFQAGGISIFHGDFREVVPQLPALPGFDLVLADPPYGINYRSTHNSGWRDQERVKWFVRKDGNFPGITGDDKPPQAEELLIGRKHAIFGGNYCIGLPNSRCWIVWDKNDGKTRSNQADCEMVWTDFDRPSRVYRHLWRGVMRAGEENVSNGPKLHPHQKPVALLRFIVEQAELNPHSLILDTHCGSGSTLVVAQESGHSAIGIEIEEAYCEVAAKRLFQGVLELT